ncbi:PAC motif-containing protein [Tanacetum coccineum]
MVRPRHRSLSYPLYVIRNRAAGNLYGYTVTEECGKNPTQLLVKAKVAMYSNFVLKRTVDGESWSGSRFPVKNKRGERFVVSGTNTPLRNENRRLIGAICISSDDCPYHVIDRQLTASRRLCLDYQQASIGRSASSNGGVSHGTPFVCQNGEGTSSVHNKVLASQQLPANSVEPSLLSENSFATVLSLDGGGVRGIVSGKLALSGGRTDERDTDNI